MIPLTTDDQALRDIIVITVSVVITVSIVFTIVLIMLLVIVFCCLRKRSQRYELNKVQELPNVMLETKEKKMEAESLIDGMNI